MESPHTLPDSIMWPEETKRWWNALSSVAGSESWTDADWSFALDTALCHRELWMSGDLNQLKELRMREQQMGITPAARAKTSPAQVTVAIEKTTTTPLQQIIERRVEHHGATR